MPPLNALGGGETVALSPNLGRRKMSPTNCGHLSLQKSNGRPLCPKCRAPMWNIRVQAEKAADIRERSNVHAANIRTLQCSMTILVRQPQNSDRESALCDRRFFTRKSASARNASLDNGQKRTPRSSVLMNSSLARRVPLRQSGRLIQ